MTEIERRKNEHLDIVLNGKATFRDRGTELDEVEFVHCALPELKLADIDLGVEFLGKRMAAPILISSMTGGPERSIDLNNAVAEACNELGLAFGVGSQRIALEGNSASGLGSELRKRAPDAPILANFGAAQLRQWDGATMARRAVDMIAADALIIHINPLQEAVQHGGDTDWRGILAAIGILCRDSDIPVVCKEVGSGLSGDIARRLVEAGVAAIDVAGAGGTSWAGVEAERAVDAEQRRIAEAFRNWGIPTARSIVEVRKACPTISLIASGGIRNGIDCAKSIRLGADLVGTAAGILSSAVEGTDSLISKLNVMMTQLRIACFCTGSADLTQLRRAPLANAPSYFEREPTA